MPITRRRPPAPPAPDGFSVSLLPQSTSIERPPAIEAPPELLELRRQHEELVAGAEAAALEVADAFASARPDVAELRRRHEDLIGAAWSAERPLLEAEIRHCTAQANEIGPLAEPYRSEVERIRLEIAALQERRAECEAAAGTISGWIAETIERRQALTDRLEAHRRGPRQPGRLVPKFLASEGWSA